MARHKGVTSHALYYTYNNMKCRCYKKGSPAYKNYGGRGITICKSWLNSFPNFLNWAISSGWNKSLSLERIDNNKGYSPSNCKWATRYEQSRNNRRNKLITFNGKTLCSVDWSKETGINRRTITSRIEAGWPLDQVLTKRPISFKRRTYEKVQF